MFFKMRTRICLFQSRVEMRTRNRKSIPKVEQEFLADYHENSLNATKGISDNAHNLKVNVIHATNKQTNKCNNHHIWYPRAKASLLEVQGGCTTHVGSHAFFCSRIKGRLMPHGLARFAILFQPQPRLFAFPSAGDQPCTWPAMLGLVASAPQYF